MSVNDALAAIQVIHTVVSKVKDNQDELKSLSKRLQYIVQSLEDSRRRDIIREAEYEDSLSAVFELITRTERVTRRMLKRSLGDRTWNAGEIASDLRRLNEDAQTFLSVHTIKTLDLVQTAQTQQQSYLVSSVEEIIAKITEIDLALSKSTSKPPPMVATPAPPVTAMMLQTSPARVGGLTEVTLGSSAQFLSTSGLYHSPSWTGHTVSESAMPNSAAGKSALRLQETETYAASIPTEDTAGPLNQASGSNNSDHLDTLLVDFKLPPGWLFPLTISGLHLSGELYGPGSLEATFNVPGGASVDQIKDIVEHAGYQRPTGLVEDRTMFLKVTEGDSVFDATAPEGLQISKDEPLLWWMNRYDEYHGITMPTPMKTKVEWTRNLLKVQNLSIRCHRTLRVPDTGNASHLPPDMGTFPFFPVSQLGSKVPEDMQKRGGFITPMFRREALWISFECGPNRPAVKVSVGGINVISGASVLDTSPLQHGPQDYIVAGEQPWIDGIATGENVVRQFVVTEMGKGYTVEEQVTGEAKVGGLQFDIFPRRSEPPGDFYRAKSTSEHGHLVAEETGRRFHTVCATPAELDLEGQTIAYVRWIHGSEPKDIQVLAATPWVLSGYARRISRTSNLSARYPDRPSVVPGTKQPVGRLAGSMGRVESQWKNRSSLGVAAGGKIQQNIYRDRSSIRVYNQQLCQRIHVHIVTPEFWENLTGVLPPVTPVTRDGYARHGIPWFKLFDDYVDSIAEVSEALASVLSVSELDKLESSAPVKAQEPVVNPDAPPPCFQHRIATSSTVFRPCGHAVCAQCLGHALLGGSKCSCGSPIAKFVGMKEPLPQVNTSQPNEEEESDGGMHHWSVQEIERLSSNAVQSGTLTVVHRPEDSVAPLQQQNPISPTMPYWQHSTLKS